MVHIVTTGCKMYLKRASIHCNEIQGKLTSICIIFIDVDLKPWRCRQYVHSKYWYLPASLHDNTSHISTVICGSNPYECHMCDLYKICDHMGQRLESMNSPTSGSRTSDQMMCVEPQRTLFKICLLHCMARRGMKNLEILQCIICKHIVTCQVFVAFP
jgi:hypothetical protein